MNDNEQEYMIFHITAKDGSDVEMAVIDEFEFEKKNYVAAARVVDDTIDEEGIFIYRVRETEDDYEFEKITNAVDYSRIAEAYMEME